jgi:hypothetical protein
MMPTANNFKLQIKVCFQRYKETGNRVWRQYIQRYYEGYVSAGGKMALKDIVKSDILQGDYQYPK